MATNTKGIVYGGSPPYTLQLINNGNVIHTVIGNDDKLTIPDEVIAPLNGILRFVLKDSAGKGNTVDIDKISWTFMKNHHAGRSISNGDFTNHLNDINESAIRGMKYLGLIYHENDIGDDAALNALGDSGEYNHRQFYQTYLKGFDKVLSTAYANGVQLKVSLWVTRSRQSLNNGTTRTLFVSDADAQLREDGQPTSRHNDMISAVVQCSYASAQFRSFVHRLFINFTKRYLPAILDGTIIAYGIVSQDTAEEEFQYLRRGLNNEIEGEGEQVFSRGDFHPAMVAAFKAKYPEYASLNNFQIAESLQISSLSTLGNRWRYHMEKTRADFVKDLIEATLTAVPGLRARSKFYQYDSSSLITQVSRGNSSAFQRFHKAALIIKSNDFTTQGDWIRFCMDYNLAAARSVSAVCMVEPTPPNNHDFILNRESVNGMVQFCKERGIHLSWVTADWPIIDSIQSQFQLLPLVPPKEVPVSKFENGRHVTKRFIRNLSQVYIDAYGGQNFSNYQFKTDYYNFLSANNLQAADILVVNNVA